MASFAVTQVDEQIEDLFGDKSGRDVKGDAVSRIRIAVGDLKSCHEEQAWEEERFHAGGILSNFMSFGNEARRQAN